MSQQRNGAGVGVAGAPAPFLIKTHQMVEDVGTDDVISWNEEGSSFVVWKPVEFARDLLSKYFKHNNFSSFVRQLNTYGFRKVVPDRWEFANEHFKRGEQRLLSEIHRRKTSTAGGRSNGRAVASTSNSREDEQTSSSTSSTLQLPPAQQLYELSEENEKLRKDNQQLSSELALSKKHCEQLLGFLSKYVDVDNLDLLMMMKQQQEVVEQEEEEEDEEEEEEEEEEETEGVEEGGGGGGEQSLKLFGVWLKEEDRKKRVRCEMEGTAIGVAGRPSKKAMAFEAPWMEMSTPPVQGTSKVFHSTLPFLKQKG